LDYFIGALFHHRLLLYLYAISLTMLILLEIGAFIAAMSLRVRVRNSYEDSLWHVFRDAYVNNQSEVRHAVERLEQKFECCGVYGSDDYDTVNCSIPMSCYKNGEPSKEPFPKSCADAIIDWIWDEMPIIGSILCVVLLLEIVGVISSCSLAAAISHYSYAEIHTKQSNRHS
jgi:hypothetical protein